MKGLTDYITQSKWSDLLTVQFVLVDDAYQQLESSQLPDRWFAPRGEPKFSDSEVITLALFAEMVFAGAEDKMLHFIRQYHSPFAPTHEPVVVEASPLSGAMNGLVSAPARKVNSFLNGRNPVPSRVCSPGLPPRFWLTPSVFSWLKSLLLSLAIRVYNWLARVMTKRRKLTSI